jgi:uncharacterized protein (TIGR03503 family)
MQQFLVLVLVFCSFLLSAQTAQTEQNQPIDKSPLTELGDEYQNGIKLLQNRFRIDYKVEEITMVFFRKFGSPPVVLVRPDGSKIFQIQADGENVFWYDAATYDLVSIKNPMPGPWQAVGNILPESRVMVLSDITLKADPLPDVIFSGEILKQTAFLTNGGQPINYAEFRDVVSLDIRLASTNNPNFNNFGAEVQTIAQFEDNGRGMDETPLDGTFTGQFNLALPDGEWTPIFVVSTPMFTREQVDPNLMLYPNPIKIDVMQDGGGEGYHKLLIDAEREFVDMSTLLIDGKIRFPNGDVQNFSLTEQTEEAREHLIVNYEYGVYRVKLTAYGNTKSGRDFILDVPEYSFLAEEPAVDIVPEQPEKDPTESVENSPVNTTSSNLPNPVALTSIAEEPKMANSTLVIIIIAINSVLLIGGGGLIWFVMRSKKSKAEQFETESGSITQQTKAAKKSSSNKKAARKNSESGIIDLSLPDD